MGPAAQTGAGHVEAFILLVICDGSERFNLNISKGIWGKLTPIFIHSFLAYTLQTVNRCTFTREDTIIGLVKTEILMFRRTWFTQCTVFVSVGPSWCQACRSTPSSTGDYYIQMRIMTIFMFAGFLLQAFLKQWRFNSSCPCLVFILFYPMWWYPDSRK